MESSFAGLEKAFEALERLGFVARMNFSCCSSCAIHELAQEGVEQEDPFVFFHMQDAQNLYDTGKCFLAWGSTVEHGQTIVEALKAHGVNVSWCGQKTRRIFITIDPDTVPDEYNEEEEEEEDICWECGEEYDYCECDEDPFEEDE